MVHRNYLFLLLGIISLGLIAFSPAIYAAIEPHITITMDLGQSTNPFQIKDDSNNDVFSIDTYGTIEGENGWVDLYWKQEDSSELILINNNVTKIVLAQWNFNPVFAEVVFDFTVNRDSVVFGQINLIDTGGLGSCFFRAEYTDDDFATWQSYGMEIQRGGFGYESDYDFWFADSITNDGIEGVRLVVYQTSTTGECHYRGLVFAYSVIDSELYDIVRVT